jgi:hypothetical protein
VNFTYPPVLSAGLELAKPGWSGAVQEQKAKKAANGAAPKKFHATVAGRKVIGAEAVTTRAGSFDAWKIEYDLSGQSQYGSDFAFHIVEYFVPGTGVVKALASTADGTLYRVTELGAIEKK